MKFPHLPLGPLPPDEHGKRQFRVWAPVPKKIELVVERGGAPEVHQLRAEEYGYFISEPIPAEPGLRYGYQLNGKRDKTYPDPASRYQPDGVHGLSEVVRGINRDERTLGQFKGVPLSEAVIYELHVGTFTNGGTFDSAIERLDYLADLGINTIELLPLNQTPGDRNWGYDGVLPFAVFRAYGGPDGLHRFIRAAHERGIAVLIDVIYNHLGPEGNYLPKFMPVFTEHHKTPWGPAINMDDRQADGVRNYYLQNVRMWLDEFGADGLRLDAVHAIKDYGAEHFLAELSRVTDSIAALENRTIVTLAECDLNAPRFIRPISAGGYGLTGQWVDEFHHALHGVLTGERLGYYEDFGEIDQLEQALRDGYVYTGQYSNHRQRNFGPAASTYQGDLTPAQFVVFLQNHDQIGNRMVGDRLSTNISPEKYLLGAATYLFSPFTPLLFQGEEYGERRPFPYFVHHGDDWLIEAVRKGRAAEFAAFQRPGHTVPDPQGIDTFESAKLSWETEGPTLEFYRSALHLRARHISRTPRRFADIHVTRDGTTLRWTTSQGWTAVGNYGDREHTLDLPGTVQLTSGGASETATGLRLPAFSFAFLTH